MKTTTATGSEKKLHERKSGNTWTREKAERVFLGLDGTPTPFTIWETADLYLARHSSDPIASKARKMLKLDPKSGAHTPGTAACKAREKTG